MQPNCQFVIRYFMRKKIEKKNFQKNVTGSFLQFIICSPRRVGGGNAQKYAIGIGHVCMDMLVVFVLCGSPQFIVVLTYWLASAWTHTCVVDATYAQICLRLRDCNCERVYVCVNTQLICEKSDFSGHVQLPGLTVFFVWLAVIWSHVHCIHALNRTHTHSHSCIVTHRHVSIFFLNYD